MVTVEDIREAEISISPYIIHTPLIYSPSISLMTGAEVYLKLETLQKSGSFKIRGAINKILSNRSKISRKGVVTASAGNHAQGVSLAAHAAGVPATVVMPLWSSLSKQEAARAYGADIRLFGKTFEESMDRALELVQNGMLLVHPFDDPDIIAGQGTIGLEVIDSGVQPDLIVVPVGGGGLIAGVAIVIKKYFPSCQVIGVQSDACPSAYHQMKKGGPEYMSGGSTIADGIRVAKTGKHTFEIIKKFVNDIVLVDDSSIADAILLLLERKKIVAEGAGAASLAALISGKINYQPGNTIVLVISGGNIDSHQLSRVIRQALARSGRLVRLNLVLEDHPGSLSELLAIIARKEGNILQISHNEWDVDLPVLEKRIWIEIETRGKEQSEIIQKAIQQAGIKTCQTRDTGLSQVN